MVGSLNFYMVLAIYTSSLAPLINISNILGNCSASTVHYVVPITSTPRVLKSVKELVNYSTSGVLSPSGSREEYFSRTYFLALILSNSMKHLVLEISIISMNSFGVKTLSIPGCP